MRRSVTAGLLLTALLGGCRSRGEPAPMPQGAPTLGVGIEHPYFPLRPGTRAVLEGEQDGLPRREEVQVLARSRRILGIACTGVHQDVWIDGVLGESTTEWFCQDGGGNLWQLGEESLEPVGGAMQPTPDSWIAGQGGAWPWMVMAAVPRVGDRYLGFRPGAREELFVRSVSAAANVAAGSFRGCLEIVENPGDVEDEDIILYGPGVGRLSEANVHGVVELESVR